jgi:hypothetical protein
MGLPPQHFSISSNAVHMSGTMESPLEAMAGFMQRKAATSPSTF